MAQKKLIKPAQQKPLKPKQSVLPVFKPNIWLALICAAAGFALYFNTRNHDYVLDDVGAITGNQYVMEGIKGIPKILSVGMWHFDNVQLGYYRPLSMITFAIENQFLPGDPHVSHWGNIILYALTGFFLCMLLMSLFRNFHPAFSFIITLLFIAHPIHTEVIANIKSRDEILAFLGMISGLYFLLKNYSPERKVSDSHSILLVLGWAMTCVIIFWIGTFSGTGTSLMWAFIIVFVLSAAVFIFMKKLRYILLAVMCFYFALLSKESAMTGLLIAPLMLFFSSNISIGKALLRTISFALMILIFQVHKLEVIGTLTGQIPKDIVNYPYTEADTKFSSTFLIFWHCIKLITWPYRLTYDYSYNQIPSAGFGSPLVILGFLIALALAFFSFKGLFKKSPLAFGVLFFCVTLAPALAFVFIRGGILAERFLYAPSLGFSIVSTFLIIKLFKINIQSPELKFSSLAKELKLILPTGIIFALYSFKTITRNPVWQNNMTLFSTDVNSSPESCQVRRHYGSELINVGISVKDSAKRKEIKEAIEVVQKNNPDLKDSLDWFKLGTEQLKTALRINPHFGDALFKLGVAYQTVKVNNDSAIFYYTRAIQEAPGYAISYNNMGILYEGLGKQELASYYYNKAVEANPYFPDGLRNRDNHRKVYGLDVRMFPTSTNLDSLIQSTPEAKRDFEFYYKLGTDYASKGDYINASRMLEKAISLNPNAVDALVNLSNCYGMIKNYEKNIEMLNRVIALQPKNVQALGNLAVTYDLLAAAAKQAGNNDKAGEYKDKSEEYRDKVRELTGQ